MLVKKAVPIICSTITDAGDMNFNVKFKVNIHFYINKLTELTQWIVRAIHMEVVHFPISENFGMDFVLIVDVQNNIF